MWDERNSIDKNGGVVETRVEMEKTWIEQKWQNEIKQQ